MTLIVGTVILPFKEIFLFLIGDAAQSEWDHSIWTKFYKGKQP